LAVETARRKGPKDQPRKGPGHASQGSEQKETQRGFFRRYWWVFVAVPCLGGFLVFAMLLYVYAHLKLPDTPPPLQTTYIYASDGRLIGDLHASVDRTIIPFRKMPTSIRHAVIATEDRNFYSNPGFDLIGILRAAWTDLVSGGVVQGGSTITQQLVKNVYAGRYVEGDNGVTEYVTPPRTIGQKVREVLLAVKLNRKYSKDQILAKYLNTIYFGHGAYGIEAASETYFGHPAEDLRPLESALLAGMIQNPTLYDPGDADKHDLIIGRRNYVLDQMVEEHYLTSERADQIRTKPIRLPGLENTDETSSFGPKIGYFLDYVRRELLRRYTGDEVFGGGLRVTTSLDREMQSEAQQAVAEILRTPGDPEAALVAIDPRTGEVKAMYGGRNFQKSQVNLALSGAKGYGGTGRQAGSAFKPFTLVAALEDHISPNSYWYGPSTKTIPDPECYTKGQPWTLSNASDEESGTFSLWSATAHSVNTIFAQVVAQVGPEKVADVAHRMGIRSPLHGPGQPVPCAITLGTQSVNPLEMTNAYATLAAGGEYRRASPIAEIRSGSIDYERKAKGEQVITRNIAAIATHALEGVISFGTGTAARLADRPAAGKTGTAQDYVDAWFCGYVPQLATCVWIGYPKAEIPLEGVEGYSAVYGGTLPALIWNRFMTAATAGLPVRDFPTYDLSGFTGHAETSAPVATSAPSPTATGRPSPSRTSEAPPTHSPQPTQSPSPVQTVSPTPPATPPATPS
jgi:penicillin-binding protein 1A